MYVFDGTFATMAANQYRQAAVIDSLANGPPFNTEHKNEKQNMLQCVQLQNKVTNAYTLSTKAALSLFLLCDKKKPLG